MDHPITKDENKSLRGRLVQLLSTGYKVGRSGNIVFVCGGNEETSMRKRFQSYCEINLKEYDIFFPEFAMDDYFSGDVTEPFDIADFEEIVGEISHAIVMFPEGPGSFAETGYFAAKNNLVKRAILVLDSDRQAQDSFISMGPAKIISENSRFNPFILISYNDPNFEPVTERVKRHNVSPYKKTLSLNEFKNLSKFELLGLIHKICDILSIVTIDDLEFILRAIFSSQISVGSMRKVASILVGSRYLLRIGEYGHLHASQHKSSFLSIRPGFSREETEIRLRLAEVYEKGDQEFNDLVEASRDVA